MDIWKPCILIISKFIISQFGCINYFMSYWLIAKIGVRMKMPKLQFQNLTSASTSKSWPNLETLRSKSEQKLNFKTKLLSTRFLSSTWARVAVVVNLNKFELSSSHARVTSIKFTKQELVSESVSQSVTDKHSQWSDSGPIKTVFLRSGWPGRGSKLFR